MLRRLHFLGLLAGLSLAGCGTSQPVNMPPPARQQTTIEEAQLSMPPEPTVDTKPEAKEGFSQSTTPVLTEEPLTITPVPADVPPSTGRAVGRAVMRAFGLPIPATEQSSVGAGPELTTEPPSDGKQP